MQNSPQTCFYGACALPTSNWAMCKMRPGVIELCDIGSILSSDPLTLIQKLNIVADFFPYSHVSIGWHFMSRFV